MKMDLCSFENKIWPYAGTSLEFQRVTGWTVETISRKDPDVNRGILRDYTPESIICRNGYDIVRSAWRHAVLNRNI